MDFDQIKRGRFIHKLRRALPLPAHARPALIASLRARGVITRVAPRLIILDVFDAGDAGGLMCRFAIADDGEASSFVAPFAQVALARRRPAARSRAAPRRPPSPFSPA